MARMKHILFRVIFLHYDHKHWTFINNNLLVLLNGYYMYKYKGIFGKKFDIGETLKNIVVLKNVNNLIDFSLNMLF